MAFFADPWVLVGFTALTAIAALAMVRGPMTVDGFFGGREQGRKPQLWTLVLSQVTTWIFARSLMNAAILGYFYGFAGALAYTAYYLSFLTGGFIVGRIRESGGSSVQDYLGARFGQAGHWSYNFIIALRLLSEVFANLIVIGLIFAALFPESAKMAEVVSIILLGAIGLLYSARGGLSASLKTDVLQMLIFLVVFIAAFLILIFSADFSLTAVLTAEGVHDQGARPGWVLVAVAFLQVFSYPAHDPVMMDRGFIADDETTRKSFIYAFLISAACIFGFGMFGIQAGLIGAAYESQLIGTWAGMFGPFVFFLLMVSLLVSALSTLDSALSSASRLVIEEWKLLPKTLNNGRIAMVAFAVIGGLLTFFPNKTLFDAVAVTGTASMFLTPVLIYSFLGYRLPVWSYLVAWAAAVIGAAAYMYRGSDFWMGVINPFISTPEIHKYDQLLVICIGVLAVGFAAGALGILSQQLLGKRAGG